MDKTSVGPTVVTGDYTQDPGVVPGRYEQFMAGGGDFPLNTWIKFEAPTGQYYGFAGILASGCLAVRFHG